MKHGTLNKTNEGWVVKYTKKKASNKVLFDVDVIEELNLHQDSITNLSPSLENITHWDNKEIQFEVVKVFLADKTQYLAKVRQPKIVLSWDSIASDWLSSDESPTLLGYLKENYKVPTKK